ncbi:MAG: glycosyltransferase [Cohaesibacteraceae bacterium]|nr:glycosyltransferase [Cohaesibacteraceae bacterium]MBL4876523.1 glycosyltransferase [Cohaesibacteraceae bacterium]
MPINRSVSVIIPTWNRAHCIVSAIESALAQTIEPLEILVCDDGSSDNTEEIVRKLKNPKIRWIPGNHGGRPAIPRNRGIKQARGEWIAFLDSDDEWFPHKLECQFCALKESSVDAICSNVWCSAPNSKNLNLLLPTQNEIITWKSLLKKNQVHCSSVLLKRSLFEAALGFPESKNLKVGEDYALWIRISIATNFAYLAEPLLVYLDDPQNSVRAFGPDRWSQRIFVLSDFLHWYQFRTGIQSTWKRKITLLEIFKAKFCKHISRFMKV